MFLHPGQHQAGHAVEVAVDKFFADPRAFGDGVDAHPAHARFQYLGFQRLQDQSLGIFAAGHGLFLHEDEEAGGVRHAGHLPVSQVGNKFADGVADSPSILPDFAAQVDHICTPWTKGP
ncbi:hypothetical protein D3C87_1325810 [compost metagenome]